MADPEKRLDAEGILSHPWISSAENQDNNLEDVPKKISEYNAKRRLKRAGQAVLAV